MSTETLCPGALSSPRGHPKQSMVIAVSWGAETGARKAETPGFTVQSSGKKGAPQKQELQRSEQRFSGVLSQSPCARVGRSLQELGKDQLPGTVNSVILKTDIGMEDVNVPTNQNEETLMNRPGSSRAKPARGSRAFRPALTETWPEPRETAALAIPIRGYWTLETLASPNRDVPLSINKVQTRFGRLSYEKNECKLSH